MVGSKCNGAFSGSTAAAFEAKNQVLPTVSHFFQIDVVLSWIGWLTVTGDQALE